MLQARGYRRFIVAGVCSGAHTAYRAGLDIEDARIEEMVLVNPWQFYWVEGMSLSDQQHFVDVAAYRKSMQDPRRWDSARSRACRATSSGCCARATSPCISRKASRAATS